jgi:NAD(P)-dependent dehydrogenase (short-subunit alcohol dehydrogenase family)
MLVAPYAVAKAGVEQLGRALNAELSLHNATATVAYFGFVDTDMVRKAIDERPTQAQELTPAFLRKRITPQQAGEAVASAIEQRSPRVIAPRYWAVASTLRGLINPALDRLSTKSTKIQQALTEADGSGSLPSATD